MFSFHQSPTSAHLLERPNLRAEDSWGLYFPSYLTSAYYQLLKFLDGRLYPENHCFGEGSKDVYNHKDVQQTLGRTGDHRHWEPEFFNFNLRSNFLVRAYLRTSACPVIFLVLLLLTDRIGFFMKHTVYREHL